MDSDAKLMLIWFKLIRVCLAMHSWLLKDMHFIANNFLKFNNAVNARLINLKITLSFIKYS